MNLLIGVVEDILDPLEIGRVQVRINSLHPTETEPNPTTGLGVSKDHLPWCQMLQNITSAAQNGLGISPTGIEIGSWVALSAIDNNFDVFMVIGSLAGIGDIHNSALGKPHTAATSKESLYKDEPATTAATKYPNNKTISTKSGHLIEIDDTKGAERISVYHKSGTFIEFHPEGILVEKVLGQKYSISLENNNLLAKGDININAEGIVNITSDNSEINIEAKSDVNINAKNINATSDNIEAKASNINVNGSDIVVKSSGNCKVSASSLDLQASGTIKIAAGGGVEVNAGTKIKLSGKKVVNI